MSEKSCTFAANMNRLQQSWVWMSRIGHCRGFGIQSPDDYRFVRYVVNEHWPYHAYDNLPTTNDWTERKLGRLYLRVANYMQPTVIVDLVGMASYFTAGCRHATVVSTIPTPQCFNEERVLIVTPANTTLKDILPLCSENTMLVVHQLWKMKKANSLLLAEQHVATFFDLFYCAIAFFCKRYERHHYIVNF